MPIETPTASKYITLPPPITPLDPPMMAARNAGFFAPFARLKEQIDEQHEALANASHKTRSLTDELLSLLNQTLSKSNEAITSLRRLTEELTTRLKLHDPRDAILSESKRILQLTGSMWKNQEQSINLQINHVARKIRGRPRRQAEEDNWQPPQQMMRELPRQSRAVAENIGRELARSQCGSVNSQYRLLLQKEFYVVKTFVTQNLSKMLEVDETSEIPKKVVLNSYLTWNQTTGRKLLIEDNSRIQMELTNQLKAIFPKVENMRKTFRGLRFKDEHSSQLELTDRAPPHKDDEVFDETDYYDPLEALLKEDPDDDKAHE